MDAPAVNRGRETFEVSTRAAMTTRFFLSLLLAQVAVLSALPVKVPTKDGAGTVPPVIRKVGAQPFNSTRLAALQASMSTYDAVQTLA